MATYNVKFADKSKAPVTLPETSIDESLGISLFGRRRLAYGQDMNQNMLSLLETFSCPQSDDGGYPQPSEPERFQNPIEGRLWYNSTPGKEGLYYWNGDRWIRNLSYGEIAANWGVIASGGQIPLPVSPNGRTYRYDECSWVVSPYGFPNAVDYFKCETNANAVVTMEYSLVGSSTTVGGYANYIIIGIPDNNNIGAPAGGSAQQ